MKFFSLFLSLFLFSSPSWGKVLLIQWSDVHSEIESMTRQLYAMDQIAQEFKAQNPQNSEVVIYILGDFTSLVPLLKTKGWLLFQAIKLLRDRGYTVLFTPGNHDAFDWIQEAKDTQLFIDQMQKITEWGAVILAENLRDRSPTLDSLIRPSYPLKTLKPTTHIIGFTLDRILSHSNFNNLNTEPNPLFQIVEKYDQSLKRILPQAKEQGIQQIFLGLHEGHKKVAKLAVGTDFMKTFGIDIPLMMAAHDHLVVSYKRRNTSIVDGGSRGSFNAIEISETGEILNVEHITMSASKNNPDLFQLGSFKLNETTQEDIQNSWLKNYEEEIQKNVIEDEVIMATQQTKTDKGTAQEKNKKLQPVNITRGIRESKLDMQYGNSYLGTLMAETLAEWLRSLIPESQQERLITMFNSSTYRLEEPIKEGPLTKRLIWKMYPYKTEPAKFYKMRGAEIENLYFSLRRDYISRSHDESRYSPYLNSNVREFENRLQIQEGEIWTSIDKNQFYWLAIDPWLARHGKGGSYKIKEWLEIIEGREPEGSKNFQELLIEFFPKILRDYGHTLNPLVQAKPSPPSPLAQTGQTQTGIQRQTQSSRLPAKTACQQSFLSP